MREAPERMPGKTREPHEIKMDLWIGGRVANPVTAQSENG